MLADMEDRLAFDSLSALVLTFTALLGAPLPLFCRHLQFGAAALLLPLLPFGNAVLAGMDGRRDDMRCCLV